LLNQQKLAEIILDSMFLLPKITGNGDPLNIPGIRGWVSSLDEPFANRIGLVSLVSSDKIDRKIQQVLDFFSERNKGFTWVVGPMEIDAGLPDRLLAHGFIPTPHFHQLAGMYLKAPFPRLPENPKIHIRKVEPNEIAFTITVITRAYGLSQEVAHYIYSHLPTPAEIRSQLYLAYPDENGCEPVGFGNCTYIPHYPIVSLRGSGVVPEHRGKGIYKALIRQRLADVYADGIDTITVYAVRDTSYPILQRWGFQEICAIEWYQWSPSPAQQTVE